MLFSCELSKAFFTQFPRAGFVAVSLTLWIKVQFDLFRLNMHGFMFGIISPLDLVVTC